ncbi:MAG: DUF4388 domain-containing protein [Candidatus Aminicenantes bacterium]|nr:DUF4388 domain-containing protein [Candidatus Aminicenantes bacterium]
MKDAPFEGRLAEKPFPRLLFELWTRERSGRLRLRREDEERLLFFETGRLVLARESLDERGFLGALVRKKVLRPEQAESAGHLAALKGLSVVKAAGELGLLSPLPLWNLLESFFVRRLFILFGWEEGGFDFEPGPAPPAESRFGLLEVHDLILQGIRQMQNDRLIERFLPGPDDPIRVSVPYFLPLLALDPHERYALNLLGEVPSLRSFLSKSELGARESRKALYAFACLGVLGASLPKAGESPAAEAPASNPVRMLEALNEKSVCLFRYVSKEAGPVAQSILGKALDDLKPGLGPLFQSLALLPDGRIEVDPSLKLGNGRLSAEIIRKIQRGFDDILMAEVLAVRKSLGPAHEAAVVRNMEKAGCV